jgi:iron only hydrogenase large subunit-like protein
MTEEKKPPKPPPDEDQPKPPVDESMTTEELEKRMDELAREFAKTHDKEVEAELEALRGRVAAMKRRLT